MPVNQKKPNSAPQSESDQFSDLFRELSEKYPGADLRQLVESLDESFNRLPETARNARRPVWLHLAAAPNTVRMLKDLVERLCP